MDVGSSLVGGTSTAARGAGCEIDEDKSTEAWATPQLSSGDVNMSGAVDAESRERRCRNQGWTSVGTVRNQARVARHGQYRLATPARRLVARR